MKDATASILILLAGVLLASSPYLPASSIHQATAAVARKKASSGATYLLQEDMEGTGTPAGWTDNASPNWDDTTNNIIGTKSWSAGTSSSHRSDSPSWGPVDDAYIFFAITLPTASGNVNTLQLNNSGMQAEMEYRSNGALRIQHGTVTANTGVFGAGTFYVWIDYVKGTGANGTMDIYVSSTQTRPGTADASITTGDGGSLDTLRIAGHANTMVFDKIRIDDVSIGSSPE